MAAYIGGGAGGAGDDHQEEAEEDKEVSATYTAEMHMSPQEANALRRHLLAKIPTMAFDEVQILKNTSFVSSDLLVHRLCLVPLKIDARAFEERQSTSRVLVESFNDESIHERNTVQFELRVSVPQDCQQRVHDVVSARLEWIPLGRQRDWLRPPTPVYANIPILKLGPGQEIHLVARARRGISSMHPKWKAVTVAHYMIRRKLCLLQPSKRHSVDVLNKIMVHAPKDALERSHGRLTVGPCANKFYAGWDGGIPKEASTILKVTYVPKSVMFTFESNGIYSPRELLGMAQKHVSIEKTVPNTGSMVRCVDTGLLGVVDSTHDQSLTIRLFGGDGDVIVRDVSEVQTVE